MKRNRILSRIAAGVISAFAALASIAPAGAVSVVLCPSVRSQGGSSAGQISIPNLSTTYAADAQGCVIASGFGDISILRASGYSESGKHRSLFFVTGALPASGTTDIPGPTLPAGAYIQQIIIQNTTANAVTGGVAIGSTANGTDIATAATAAANSTQNATLLRTAFSTTAGQVIHFAPVTSSNSANLTISVIFGYF